MSPQNTANSQPDFAFPQQVIKDADKILENALKEGDGIAVVDALIRSGLAQTAISPDSLPSVITKIEAVNAKETDEVTKALLDMLLANIYGEYYQDNKYNFDARPELANPSDDITLWSGKEFKEKIIALYQHALSYAPVLKKARISDYSSVIICDKTTAIFYPTLFDFASRQAIDGISSLSDETMRVLSPLYFYNYRLTLPNVMAKPSQEAILIADSWVESNEGAPRIAAILSRYELIDNYVVEDSEEEEDNAVTTISRLYEDNKENPYAVEILLNEDFYNLTIEQKKDVYGKLKEFAAANPTYFRINMVKNALAELTEAYSNVKFPAQVARGQEFTVEVQLANVVSTQLKVYRVKGVDVAENRSYDWSEFEQKPILSIPIKAEGVIPFTETQKISLKLEEYGVYVITTSQRIHNAKERFDPIYCSDIALLDTDGNGDLRVFAVDGISGAPLKEVAITTYSNQRDKLSKWITKLTDADGSVKFGKLKESNVLIQAEKGSDIYAPVLREYLYPKGKSDTITTAFVRSSLAIYHPGDSLDFVAVVYDYSGKNRSLVKNAKLKATLRNPNYAIVDTIEINTDNYGRATGQFKLPEEGLTGDYSIELYLRRISLMPQRREAFLTRYSVMVSDYKLPTYEAKVDSVAIDESTGTVVVHGKAMTYSGFPVQNAVVEASLSGTQFGWMWNHKTVKYHIEKLSTDATGSFRWELSQDVLDASPFRGGKYEVSFILTSPSGENQSCRDAFSLSKKGTISVDSANWMPAVKDAQLNIYVLDPLGSPMDATLRMAFKDEAGKEYVVEGISRNGETKVDLSKLQSGTYQLTVASMDVDADKKETTVIVYNAKDKTCPAKEGVWSPTTAIKANATNRKAEILYGVAVDNPHVLMTIYDGVNVIEQKWLSSHKGMNRMTVTVPDSIAEMKVRLSYVNNFKEWESTIGVTVDNPNSALKVKIERMRDNLTPLANETIAIKVTNTSGTGVGAAVILDMYSKALDNLSMQTWAFTPLWSYMRGVAYGNNLMSISINDNIVSAKRLPVIPLGIPTFNLYGMSWNKSDDTLVLYSHRPMLMSKSSSIVEEEGMISADEVKNTESFNAGNGVDESSEEAVDNVGNQYRPSEVPLAFFAPMLTADDSGNLTYSFVVPNANTTWVLNALAYNEALATALDVKEVISAKPVMVEPNMPRFLRTGDEADIRAIVMNATDSIAMVTTTFEIVDPATGSVIDTQSVHSEIEGRGSVTVKFHVAAPATAGAMMVRIKSSTDDYSDGAMNLLPILPSSQPVIESTTFYLTPNQKQFAQEVPAATTGSTVTLSFCENPTWEVVSALPGLRADNATTSLAASAQIFAAAISEHVILRNPRIAQVLMGWLATSNDSNMLSKLNQNEELKQLVLAATPWVDDAQSDEERITRLALLFDRKEIDRNMKSAIKKLEKMQRSGGGWSWTDSYEVPSEWVTMMILNNFAELRQLNCCPDALDKMISKALGYIDSEIVKSHAKYPKGYYSYYAYIRSLYPEVPMSVAAQKVYDEAVQRTLKSWKKSATAGKAADALLLYRSGYKKVANQILESLREYATSTPQLGMWWDSVDGSSWHSLTQVGQTAFILQAFNTIDPGCADIDKIRQWLILNKIVQDWGTSVDVSATVAAILQSGTSWTYRPGDAEIKIAGKPVEIDRIDNLTGQVVTSITGASGDLEITRTAEGPAWGAVVTQSDRIMKDVKAHSIPELSIDKQLFVRTEEGWAPTDTMVVGQVVKVRLVMTANRDMSYVTVVDNRAATFEPVVQTPRPVYCDGLVFYLENRDASTNLFIDIMPKGQYVVEYEVNVNNAGEYSSGIATIQSQYTPEMTAHSSGTALKVAD